MTVSPFNKLETLPINHQSPKNTLNHFSTGRFLTLSYEYN
ncbi:hypothetical protein E2C01_070698 [Portunus trituberculatus]|uniref:Uncharacterized protein n=1 Tax=Portunus trituberculatus TaxID=210409 RepID=A0A5B7I2Z5_PORTR|nr:hypothetical protein [Portunus trituberculatus]